MEEEDITGDSAPSVTEAVNMMQTIKEESAKKNLKVYIIGVLSLGNVCIVNW